MNDLSAQQNEPSKIDDLKYLNVQFNRILSGVSMTDVYYSDLYGAAYRMVMARKGDELYQETHELIRNYVRNLSKKLLKFDDDDDDVKNVLLELCHQWFELSEKMDLFRKILLYSERAYEHSIGEESIAMFAWRTFRKDILELIKIDSSIERTELIKPKIKAINDRNNGDAKIALKQRTITAKKNCSFRDNRSLLCDDILVDILHFLDSSSVGLSLALSSRRFAHFSGYILRRRSRRAYPMMLCDCREKLNGEEKTDAYAIRLWNCEEMQQQGKTLGRYVCWQGMHLRKVIDQWYCLESEMELVKLPNFESPDWITGMSFIYLIDDFSSSIHSFLRLVSPLLQNCCLKFDFNALWPNLHLSNQLWPFISLFDSLCFSLKPTFTNNINIVWNHFSKWHLWAIFQSHFFPHCRDLTLPLNLFVTREIGLDAATWLHHQSTATCPRRLVLVNNQWQTTGWRSWPGINALVEQIKQEFADVSENRRHFIVELPPNCLNSLDERLLENGFGERLVITQCQIVRCPIGDEHNKFEQYYEQIELSKCPTVQINGNGDGSRRLIPDKPKKEKNGNEVHLAKEVAKMEIVSTKK